jgi:uncharacterized protein YutE (UPF0331/DUF86 family)
VTPGPINLKVVADRLETVAAHLGDLRRLPTGNPEDFRADWRNAAAAESAVRRAIEALFDPARHLLARGFGIGALEYREVAKLAAEKGLIRNQDLQQRFVEIAGFRNRLTHFYGEVTTEELLTVVRDDVGDLERLADELREAAARLASR